MSANKLPRGPHNLTPDQVAQSQRSRLIVAMANVVSAKGYAATSVADVIAEAGVSRATFYQMFRDKLDCFRATYDAYARRIADLMGSLLTAMRQQESVPAIDKLDRVLSLYLSSLAGSSSLARTFLVEVYAAGPEAVMQRRESLERFIDVVAEAFRGSSGLLGPEPEQRFAVELLVSAVSAMVTHLVATDQLDEIPGLREPLLDLARRLAALESPSEI